MRAGLAVAAVRRHALAEGGDFLRELAACLLAQPAGPAIERFDCGFVQSPDLCVRQAAVSFIGESFAACRISSE